jgi:thioredoxin-dependent peroxiredoxin
MTMLKVGSAAPDIPLTASNNTQVSLKDFRGRPVVLYFYPKDDTPGCTVEACGFRDATKKLEKLDAVVLGVSPDSVKSHGKFIEKFSLPFHLLADEDKKLCKAYGVWVKKNMYGREYFGVARSTFLIERKGKIARIFEKVKPKEHTEEVVAALKEIF